MKCDTETLFEPDALTKRLKCEIEQFTTDVIDYTLQDAKSIYTNMTTTYKVQNIDYHTTIKNELDINKKKQLWVDRIRILFYILLPIANKEEYNGRYKIGIYGSNNPESDIDISVSFVAKQGVNQLNQLIRDIEDAFITVISVPCLSLDIEFYASIVRIRNCLDTNDENYIDLTIITDDEFLQLKKLAWMSVLINNRKRDPVLPIVDVFSSVKDMIGNDTIFNILADNIKFEELENYLINIPEMKSVFDMDVYNNKRTRYYENVEKACSFDLCIRNDIRNDLTSHIPLIISLAEADLLREESYIVLATVLIIVHMKQRYDKNSYPTDRCTTSGRGKFVECGMNQRGYLIALLEQIGYMNRFYNDTNKYKKYKERLDYCMYYYTQVGGRKTKKKRKRKKKSKKRFFFKKKV